MEFQAESASAWLKALDDKLIVQFREVTLISEIEASAADHAELERHLISAMAGRFRSDVWRSLLSRYPRAIAFYLVLSGIYGYESGDFWTHTVMGDSASYSLKRKTGITFEKVCKRDGLARFPGHKGYRFVAPILLHGGIPNDSLESFYRVCIRPAAIEGVYEPRELIQYWLTKSSARYHLAKPAKHFLEQSSAIVEDFVLRCIEAAAEIEQGADDVSLSSIGLPSRVVRAFAESTANAHRSNPAIRVRVTVPSPKIFFDDIRGGVWCLLPGITLPSGHFHDIEWRMKIGSLEIKQRVPTYRIGDKLRTEEDHVYIPKPAQAFEVSLIGVTEVPRTWTFKAALGDELFLFDAYSGLLIESRDYIPAAELWVLAPGNSSTDAIGGQRLEEGPPLNDEWSSFSAQRWDLSEVKTFSVNEIEWAVSSEGASSPHLTQGRHFDRRLRHSSNEYAEWPCVTIPLAETEDFDAEISRWRLSIVEEGRRATPEEEKPISDIASIEGRYLLIDLASRAPTKPGAFVVTIKGGLGRRTSWTLRYTAGARVLEHPTLRVPEGGAWPSSKLELSVPAHLKCTPLTNGLTVENVADQNVATVRFGSNTAYGTVRLLDRESEAHVDVVLGVPSLGWRLVPGVGEWGTKPLVLSRDSIESSGANTMQVRVLPSFLGYDLDVQAQVKEGHDKHKLSGQHRASYEVSFDLRQISGFADTRYARTALELLLPRKAEPVPLFVLSERLRLSLFSAAVLNEAESYSIIFEWNESGSRLKDRLIRLWSRNRPWESPVQLMVEDDLDGYARFEISRETLRPGAYLAQMVINDPWRGIRDRYPDSRNEAVCSLVVGTESQVETALGSLPDAASSHVERAIAFETEDHDRCKDALRALEASPSSESAPLMCRALIGASRGRSLSETLSNQRRVALLDFRRQLSLVPRELLAVVDDILLKEGQEVWPDLRELLIHCDALSWSLSVGEQASLLPQLWSYWPAFTMGLFASQQLHGDGQVTELSMRGCGSSEVFDQHAEGEFESDIVAVKEDLAKQKEIFGASQPDISALSLPSEVLRGQMDAIGAMRNRIFDPGGWSLVNYEWILRCQKEESGPSLQKLIDSHRWLASRVKSLQREEDEATSDIASMVLARYDQSDRHRLINVPFIVGAVALVHRIWAIVPDVRHVLNRTEREWRALVPDVLDVAPSLFDRDFAFISLALAQAQSNKA